MNKITTIVHKFLIPLLGLLILIVLIFLYFEVSGNFRSEIIDRVSVKKNDIIKRYNDRWFVIQLEPNLCVLVFKTKVTNMLNTYSISIVECDKILQEDNSGGHH